MAPLNKGPIEGRGILPNSPRRLPIRRWQLAAKIRNLKKRLADFDLKIVDFLGNNNRFNNFIHHCSIARGDWSCES